MKKKFMIMNLSLVILLACFSGAEAKQPVINDTELIDITRVMKASEIAIQEWSLYGKSKIGFVSDFSGYVLLVESLQAKTPDLRWDRVVETDEHWEVQGYTKNAYGLTEKVTVFAYPHKKQYKTYIIYELEGKTWSQKVWEAFKPSYSDKVRLLLGNNPTIYTCVIGGMDDMMGIVLRNLAKQLVQSFDATIIESLNEETFLSLSAYTDEWKHSIRTKQHDMNLQIGLRNDGIGGKTTITIGTPIITTEY
ncbi:YwmB family TATA-box binding protein [Pseudalkalibacillus berkeleyi]|uniref:YwmB family TATA-box binding protein n=1 Tax=Pseudalkalibacillus berkeleyi TaxID=1069813 RepID=A0ABS9H1M2_9BACL|nr:YwmB family TATA-box binding protein [Pseudalkalibacillus berkeleyi]MCF6138882.1 YwmB family TATA-box binding protein [Pseudalkalibacillus berkeleyi]